MNYFRNDIKFIVIFIIIGFLVGPKIFASQKEKFSSDAPLKNITENENLNKTAKENPFDNIKITGKSAYIWDIANQKVLYAKDSETKRPLASITKMMTAIVALESAKGADMIRINDQDLQTEGDSGLISSEKWSLNNLLALTLVSSSNDGAEAIAASVGNLININTQTREGMVDSFVQKMNQKSTQLEFRSFYFTTPTGLDVGNTPGGVGSAHDVAKLFEYTLRKHSNLLQYTAQPKVKFESTENIVHRVTNTNEIASITSGIIGGKTGFTDLAGGNLAVVVDVGIQHPVAIVVLGSTKEARFTDVTKLIEATKLSLQD